MAEELIVLGGIALLVLLWGSRKMPSIPEVGRMLGAAKKEFDRASREFPSVSASDLKTGDDLLMEVARKLGLDTEGKTQKQIADGILGKAKPSIPRKEGL